MNLTLWVLVFCTSLFETLIEACSPCTCSDTAACSGQQADCTNRALTQVPTTLPSNVCRLSLDSNKITTIKENAFIGLTNIKYLFFSYNSLTTIEDNAFNNLTKLEMLWLFENKITTIKKGTFIGLTNLKSLFLNNNNITTIEDKAFNDLTKLEKLELHENKIATIRNTTFVGLTNLNQLNILNNPFDCDCKLQGLIDFVKSGSVTLAGNPRCLTPENLKGTPLVSLSAANLTCPDITTMPTTIHETESETIDATTEFMKTTYETMPSCSPLQIGNSLVVTHLYLCLFVKTMIEL